MAYKAIIPDPITAWDVYSPQKAMDFTQSVQRAQANGIELDRARRAQQAEREIADYWNNQVQDVPGTTLVEPREETFLSAASDIFASKGMFSEASKVLQGINSLKQQEENNRRQNYWVGSSAANSGNPSLLDFAKESIQDPSIQDLSLTKRVTGGPTTGYYQYDPTDSSITELQAPKEKPVKVGAAKEPKRKVYVSAFDPDTPLYFTDEELVNFSKNNGIPIGSFKEAAKFDATDSQLFLLNRSETDADKERIKATIRQSSAITTGETNKNWSGYEGNLKVDGTGEVITQDEYRRRVANGEQIEATLIQPPQQQQTEQPQQQTKSDKGTDNPGILSDIGNTLLSTGQNTWGGLQELAGQAAGALGYNETAQDLKNRADSNRQGAAQAFENVGNKTLGNYVYSPISQVAAAMIAPPTILAQALGQAGNTMGDLENAGVSGLERYGMGALSGAADFIADKLLLGKLGNLVSGESGLFGRAIKAGTTGALTETGAEGVQLGIDTAYGTNGQIGALERLAQAAGGGFVGGGFGGAAAPIMMRGQGEDTSLDNVDIPLDNTEDLVGSSKQVVFDTESRGLNGPQVLEASNEFKQLVPVDDGSSTYFGTEQGITGAVSPTRIEIKYGKGEKKLQPDLSPVDWIDDSPILSNSRELVPVDGKQQSTLFGTSKGITGVVSPAKITSRTRLQPDVTPQDYVDNSPIRSAITALAPVENTQRQTLFSTDKGVTGTVTPTKEVVKPKGKLQPDTMEVFDGRVLRGDSTFSEVVVAPNLSFTTLEKKGVFKDNQIPTEVIKSYYQKTPTEELPVVPLTNEEAETPWVSIKADNGLLVYQKLVAPPEFRYDEAIDAITFPREAISPEEKAASEPSGTTRTKGNTKTKPGRDARGRFRSQRGYIRIRHSDSANSRAAKPLIEVINRNARLSTGELAPLENHFRGAIKGLGIDENDALAYIRKNVSLPYSHRVLLQEEALKFQTERNNLNSLIASGDARPEVVIQRDKADLGYQEAKKADQAIELMMNYQDRQVEYSSLLFEKGVGQILNVRPDQTKAMAKTVIQASVLKENKPDMDYQNTPAFWGKFSYDGKPLAKDTVDSIVKFQEGMYSVFDTVADQSEQVLGARLGIAYKESVSRLARMKARQEITEPQFIDATNKLAQANETVLAKYKAEVIAAKREIRNRPYMPLKRFGNKRVFVIDRNDNIQDATHFESEKEMKKYLLKVSQDPNNPFKATDGYKYVIGEDITKDTGSEHYVSLPPDIIRRLAQAEQNSGVEQIQETLQDILDDDAPDLNSMSRFMRQYARADGKERGFSGHFTARRYIEGPDGQKRLIKGYSEDFRRVAITYLDQAAKYLAYREMNTQVEETIQSLPRASQIRNVLSEQRKTLLEPESPTQAKLRHFLYLYKLGGNIGSATGNVFGASLMLYPNIAMLETAIKQKRRAQGDKNYKKVNLSPLAEINRGFAHSLAYFKDPEGFKNSIKKKNPRLYYAITKAERQGFLKRTPLQDMVDLSTRKGTPTEVDRALDALNITTAIFDASETVMRRIAFFSSFRHADLLHPSKDTGNFSEDTPENVAMYNIMKDTTRQTAGDFGKGSRNQISQAKLRGLEVGKFALMLRSYNFQIARNLIGFAKNAMKQDGSLKPALGFMAGALAITGAVQSVPFGADVFNLIKSMGYEPEEFFKSNFDDFYADVVSRGLLSTTLQLKYGAAPDLASRAGSGSQIQTGGSLGEGIFRTLGGVLAGDINNMVYAKDQLDRGNYYRAVSQVAPSAIRNMMNAAREAGMVEGYPEGVTDWKGIPLTDTQTGGPLKLNQVESAMSALGIPPVRKAKAQEANRRLTQIADRSRSANENYAAKIADARLRGDTQALNAVLSEIQAYNASETEPAYQIDVSEQAIKQKMKEMLSTAGQNQISRAPKKARNLMNEVLQGKR